MAWAQLSIDKPHLVYIILGGFTSLFMLCSLIVKEKLYIGEATVATLVGVIFGPHAANLINPFTWGNTDKITLEFSRIVLVVQCFAVGVELPKAYMERHWKSVVFLLLPVMTFGWLMTSLFIWWMIVPLTWLEALACAACVTATDPVLASSVVGKGKFAKRVPKHLRDVLSAESGCNDGMAFPFIYLSLYLLKYKPDVGEVMFHWTCYTILYECIFGAFYGFMVGYIGRRAIRYAEDKSLIDRESFLVFYFTLALFCAGSGSMLGMDDLLIGFSAGVGFSNDGWFTEKTEESHVSNVIDLLLNLAYFVYLGTIIPWDQYNNSSVGLTPWRLSVIAIFVILFRRIPIMMALKPIIPDIKTWREALFAGHFGPIGVGAIFAAILARAELETDSTEPLAVLPPPGTKEYNLIYLIWPVTTFLVLSSILVHGSSIAVFTLGRRINTLTLSLTYTKDNEAGPSWMTRLPRISSQSRSMSKMSDTSFESLEKPAFPPGTLPPIGVPGNLLRRQKDDDTGQTGSRPSSLRPSKRRKKWGAAVGPDPGGPISQSAITPQRRSEPTLVTQESGSDTLNEKSEAPSSDSRQPSYGGEKSTPTSPEQDPADMRQSRGRSRSPATGRSADVETYEEGHHMIIEDTEGNVLKTVDTAGQSVERKVSIIADERHKLSQETSGEHAKHKGESHGKNEGEKIKHDVQQAAEHPEGKFRSQLEKWRGWGRHKDEGTETELHTKTKQPERKRGPAHAYQFGNTIIVEDEDGEVLKKYTIPGPEKPNKSTSAGEGSSGEGWRKYSNAADVRRNLQRVSTWVGLGGTTEQDETGDGAAAAGTQSQSGGGHADSEGRKDDKGAKLSSRKRQDSEVESLDDGLRMTISRTDRYGLTGRHKDEGNDTISVAGRRMSTREFLKQVQRLDPGAKIEAVDESDAPDEMKREVRREASEEKEVQARTQGRRRAGTMPSTRPSGQSTGTDAATSTRPSHARRSETQVHPSKSLEPDRPDVSRTTTADTLASDEGSQDIPTHDISATLARHGGGLTAADIRRQRLRPEAARTTTDDTVTSDDASADEIPTYDISATLARHGRGNTAAESRRTRLANIKSEDDDGEDSEQRETAAEKRRRLAALGLGAGQDEHSSSEDEDAPRIPKEEPVPEPSSPNRPRPRVQWGGESGRGEAERERQRKKETPGGLRGLFGRT